MSHQNSAVFASVWHRRAHGLARRVNFHHWLARAIPPLLAVLIVAALFELVRREAGGPIRWTEALFLLGLAGALGWAWLRARGHFCNAQQALVRLETVLHLHNRLSAAEAGVIPWPEPPPTHDDGYAPNWRLMLVPLLAGALFLLAAHLVPVNHALAAALASPISEPPEFAQVQNWINALKAADLIEPEKLQELQAALDKLRDRPPQDWYKQSDLEAANSLKELMAQSMNALSQDLDQADHAVEAMQQKAETASGPGGLQPLQDNLRKAGENLASGNLPLKRELTAQLTGGEMAMDKALTPGQMQALRQRMAEGKLAAQTAANDNSGLSQEMKDAMNAAALGPGHWKMVPGGAGGGKESAPLELHDREKETVAGAPQAVHNDDMSRAALGETLKVSASAHEVNPADYHGPQSAGAAAAQGNGGEAVWRSTYDPQEADALERFFK